METSTNETIIQKNNRNKQFPTFICGNRSCNKIITELPSGSVVKCKYCDYRVVFKTRTPSINIMLCR